VTTNVGRVGGLIAPTAKKLFRRHHLDLAIMEDVLHESGLDWTVFRPPRLLERRLRPAYPTGLDINVRGGMFISRVDLAHHMLTMVDDPTAIRRAVAIAY
jgi:putative NADH-flavin reductase